MIFNTAEQEPYLDETLDEIVEEEQITGLEVRIEIELTSEHEPNPEQALEYDPLSIDYAAKALERQREEERVREEERQRLQELANSFLNKRP